MHPSAPPPATPRPSPLSSHLIPQADDPERILDLARHLASPRAATPPEGFNAPRDLSYYRNALRVLGWSDVEGKATQAAGAMLDEGADPRRHFLHALERSEIGVRWLDMVGAESLAGVDPSSAGRLLELHTALKGSTQVRRAATLRRWLAWAQAGGPPRAAGAVQGDLFSRPKERWPSPERLPHNEGGQTVGKVIEADLADGSEALIVTGYASLDQVIRLLARRDYAKGATLRILLGNEPFSSRRDTARLATESLDDELRDYWLSRGISVLQAKEVMRATEALEVQPVEVRTAPSNRSVHAKIYATSAAITIGSSNFTANGLRLQSEANARFTSTDDRFYEAHELAEGLWDRGDDYRDALLALLRALLREVTWREALARACSEVLEGRWARRYVPLSELSELDPPLWPHQLQGISQAVWILHNLGSALVADATGSGKTRMGAWLLRAAHDRQVRSGQAGRIQQVVIAPPSIVPAWQRQLQECGLRWEINSHGALSARTAADHQSLVKAIAETDLLAVDEAHNYLNRSGRTDRLRAHTADNVVLFTATPINRGAADLLSLVELLGPDNFSDEAIEILKPLQRRYKPGANPDAAEHTTAIRAEIQQFMVRRTRSELNRIVDANQEAYQLPGRRLSRYPAHSAKFYPLPNSLADQAAAEEVVALAGQLKGVGRLGTVLELPPALALEGMTEESYLDRFVRSAASLARHLVLDCLRSSRIALYEHVHGTTAAIERLAPSFKLSNKAPTGNTVEKLQKLGGSPPRWGLSEALKRADLSWLWAPEAHRLACQADAALYQRIADLAAGTSEEREQEKLRLLMRLMNERGLVIAFDSHVLSLSLFAAQLATAGAPAKLYSGDGGATAKAHALTSLGLDSSDDRLIALCSDAFSEGMNLQKASVVVHLDTPTVIRTAEQRAGRVDRMDSPHAEVEIWWPREPAAFAPQRKELLRERHEVVSSLIGANLQLPDEPDTAVDVEELAARANIDQQDPRDLFDAFRPVRAITEAGGLVGPDIYQQLRTSQAELVSAVSLVDSDAPWGFFAVGALDRVAPRWILIDGTDDKATPPIADLAKIAALLTERLGPNTQEHPIDTEAEDVIQRLIGRLSGAERALLPMRRRRALAQAKAVLPAWRGYAADQGDNARVALIQRIERMVAEGPTDAPFADPRSLADAWLRLIRPVQREQLAKEGRRRRLVTLDDLTKPLLANPADTDHLRRCFRDIPMLPPAAERVIAMIIGVPSGAASSPTPGEGLAGPSANLPKP